jgi:competence protein ComFC
MFCLTCGALSFEVICKTCQKNLLTSASQKRGDIISFYSYDEIEPLLKYKYHPFGSRVFEILAKNSFKKFSEVYKEKIISLSIDDKIKKGYSHTAILNHSLKSKFITPKYKKLIAKNNVQYAGKSLKFRKENSRNFEYRGKKNISVILVDDVVTTGTTLKEAKEVLANYGVKVEFCLVLVDKRW